MLPKPILIILALCLLCLAGFPSFPSDDNENTGGGTAVFEMKEALPVNDMLFGVDAEWPAPGMRTDHPGLRVAITTLNIRVLRFPGGRVSNFFDLISGEFITRDRKLGYLYTPWVRWYREMSRQLHRSPAGARRIKPFADMVKSLKVETSGITPVWVMNLTTQSDLETVGVIEHFVREEVDFPYVELGSGLEDNVFRRIIPSAREYMLKAAPAIRRIRSEFKDARVAVCADGLEFAGLKRPEPGRTTPLFDAREDHWNERLIRFRDLYDAWSVRSRGCTPSLYKDIDTKHWDDLILAFPDIALTAMARRCRSYSPPLPLWVTEYNLPFHVLDEDDRVPYPLADSYLEQLKDSPLQALHLVGYLLAGIRHNDVVEMMMYHNLNGPPGVGLIDTPVPDSAVRIAPAAQLFAQLATLAREFQFMHPIRVEGGRRLSFPLPGGEDIPALQAAAFSNTERMILVALNRGSEPAAARFDPGRRFADALQITFSAGGPVSGERDLLLIPEETEKLPWMRPMHPQQEVLVIPLEPPLHLVVPGHSLVIIELHFPS